MKRTYVLLLLEKTSTLHIFVKKKKKKKIKTNTLDSAAYPFFSVYKIEVVKSCSN